MSNDKKNSLAGCFKYGCFGCLALFALLVGFLLLIGVIQATTNSGDPDPVERQARHEMPGTPVSVLTDQPDAPEILPLPEGVKPPTGAAPGRLILDLSMGDFTIQPGPPDEPLRVDADYDANSFELEEVFTQQDDGTWIYDVRFGGRGGFLGMLFRGGGESGRNKVVITIPRGYPLEIAGSIGMGESETDLGGLWLKSVSLDYSAGDHFLEFREPLQEPMEEFVLDGSMGNLEVRDLGAASPGRVKIDHGMGELLVDLQGEWRQDASIDVSFSMGECRLWLPQNAHIDIARASVGMGEKRIDYREREDLPEGAPTLTLDLSGSMGELRVED